MGFYPSTALGCGWDISHAPSLLGTHPIRRQAGPGWTGHRSAGWTGRVVPGHAPPVGQPAAPTRQIGISKLGYRWHATKFLFVRPHCAQWTTSGGFSPPRFYTPYLDHRYLFLDKVYVL